MRDIVQKTTQKTTYKDYQSYLQSYKNGNSSGSLSQTSSTSSLQSTENETQRIQPDFRKNYIENNNNNNKFTGVVINDTKKEEVKKPTMKSELFITINQPNEETFQHEEKQTTTSSTTRFSEIKQRFNGEFSNKVNNLNPKIQYSNRNNQNSKIQCQNQNSPISPKSAENNVVSDQMIYAKTAVLEQLLTTSPSLKKVPPTFPMEAPKNFNTSPKPPPLPTSKPPTVAPPSLPATKPPNLPTSKPHILPKINHQTDNQNLSPEQLLKELQTLMLMQEKANSMNAETPSFVTQQARYSEQPNPTTVVPVAEGVSDVDKGDPNVKTLVYNTYRGMLGGYNNKANNMVSTLPRNAVVQDQGVAKQVESMASQGCLNNINGRVNPKASED